MLYAILATLGFSAYVVLNKEVFSRTKLSVRNYVPLLFVFLFLISFALFPWFGEIKPEALSLKYIGLFALMILLVISWNKLYYNGLKKESLVEFELITMLYPLATIFLAAILLPYERNIHIFLAGVIAGLVLIFSHIKSHHVHFRKMELVLLWCVILMAAEQIIQRYLLEVYSPIALYCIRTGVVALIYPFMFRPNWKEFNFKIIGSVFLLGALAVFFTAMQLYAYQTIGVAFTILILLIQPVLVFTYGRIIRGEKFKGRKILAALVIIAAIIYANFMR